MPKMYETTETPCKQFGRCDSSCNHNFKFEVEKLRDSAWLIGNVIGKGWNLKVTVTQNVKGYKSPYVDREHFITVTWTRFVHFTAIQRHLTLFFAVQHNFALHFVCAKVEFIRGSFLSDGLFVANFVLITL